MLQATIGFPAHGKDFVLKRLAGMLVAASLGAILMLQDGASAALPCPTGCGAQKKTCVQTAKAANLGCKEDCRTSADATALSACMKACSGTFRSAKTSCKADLASCLPSCTPRSPEGPLPTPHSCLGACGMDLATCAQGVTVQLKSCVAGCPNGSDRLTCLQGCVAAGKEGAATCASGFQTCRDNCPGSPSGAFIE